MKSFLVRHWFLLLLLMVLAVGMGSGPLLAGPLARFPRGMLVAVVMFVTALPMSLTQLSGGARSTLSVAVALVLSMGVAPPLAWVVAKLLPAALGVGLVVAACVPCTLASAAVWTRRGEGNDAIALLVTMVTNLACFAVLPAWLAVLVGARVELDPLDLSLRLLLLVVLPVLGAQLLRLAAPVRVAATCYKPALSIVAQLGVLAMVGFGAVHAGEMLSQLDSSAFGAAVWVWLLATVVLLHLALFALGWFGSAAAGAGYADRLAVAIAGSQKTLMIGLDVALGFGGLAILPMVAYHVAQLVIDTLLVDRLRGRWAASAREPSPVES